MRAWPGARSPGSREPGHRTCSVPAPSRCRRTYAAVPCPFALSDPALSLQWPAVTEAIHSPRDAWGPEQQYMPCLDTANGQEHAAREQEKPLAPAKARVGIQCEPSPDGLRVTGITAGSSAALPLVGAFACASAGRRRFFFGLSLGLCFFGGPCR